MNISKDSKKVLFILYNEYENRRKHGSLKSKARFFSSAQSIKDNYFPDIPLEDIEDFLRELDSHNYLDNFYADGTIWTCNLSDFAITTLENYPKETFLSIADFISKFIP